MTVKEIIYKRQGVGTDNEFDSWIIYYVEDNLIPTMTLKDPSIIEKCSISHVDIDSLENDQIQLLKTKLGI